MAPLLSGATAARPLGAFSGVRPGTATNIATATSTTWTVTPFAGVIDGEALAIAGPYGYAFDANVTGSVTAAAGSARIDRLDVQVSDPAESDGSSVPSIAVIYNAGVPGSGVPVAAPARSHPLALINVPLSGGGSPTVTWNATYSAGAGGILTCTSSAVYPSAASYTGFYLDDLSLGSLFRSNGTTWLSVGGGSSPVVPTSVAGTGVSVGAAGKVTFTASSSVSINGCFTTTYDAYRIVIDVSSHSVGAFVQARLRLAGTDASGASDYVYTSITTVASSTVATAASSVWNVGPYGSALADFITIDISGPALARATRFQSSFQSTGATTARAVGQVGGDHILSTAYDGISLLAGSGTITGTVRIYGYNNN